MGFSNGKEEESICVLELIKERLSRRIRTRNGENHQLKKDISDESELNWSLNDNESQPLSSTTQNNFFEDPDVETCIYYDKTAGSSLLKGPPGMCKSMFTAFIAGVAHN